jgi:endonuclease YncB( thermonuclease family)
VEQPFAKEARALLVKLVEGKRVRCEVSTAEQEEEKRAADAPLAAPRLLLLLPLQVAHIDQYKRVVATPYVWAFPYIFGPTNVSLALVQAGLATVYRQSGAAYGTAGFFSRVLLNDPNGLGRLERAEKFAR